MNHVPACQPERRSFLARFHAGGAAIVGLILGGAARAQSGSSKAKPEPARTSLDLEATEGRAGSTFTMRRHYGYGQEAFYGYEDLGSAGI